MRFPSSKKPRICEALGKSRRGDSNPRPHHYEGRLQGIPSPKTGLTVDNQRNSRVRWFRRFERDTAQIRPTNGESKVTSGLLAGDCWFAWIGTAVEVVGGVLLAGESGSAWSVRPADARSAEVMKGGGEGRRWLLAASAAAARAVD